MQETPVVGEAIEQTAGSSSVFGIVFQNLCCSNGLKNLIERDVLLYHLLLGVRGDTDILYGSLGADSLQHNRVDLVKFAHSFAWFNPSRRRQLP